MSSTNFPLPAYSFPIDKVRHWIFEQGEHVFTVDEAANTCDLDAAMYLRRLEGHGEVQRVSESSPGRGRTPIKFRRTKDLRWSVAEAETTQRRQEELNDGLRRLLDGLIFHPLHELARRWLEQVSAGAAGAETERCARELEQTLNHLQRSKT